MTQSGTPRPRTHSRPVGLRHRTPIERPGGIHDQLLLERQPIPTPLPLSRRRHNGRLLPRCGLRRPRQPGAGLAHRPEVLVQPYEVEHVAPDMAAVTHETLAVDVHE